ncbi:uncharacterized protein LOC115741173 isoform X1 [Rhodamnia argentea]|uniref:Uncharacterized protein LOC115741173 isoform X1 n=2 Tax=Rhodamnia argentea TaxID=178133 RepID=A0A8B8P830_9MYRT|nr:uncharacterized protein LOC115741173 isoform X1 [Rhodamnia argentea]
MEFFNKAKAVRLRSFHGKYLVADDDEETVHQSKNGSSRSAHWAVEYVAGNSHVVRLRGCHGKYLAATEEPYLFSISGKKVVQSIPQSKNDKSIEWEPRKDGTSVKLRAKGGMFLRANGSMPPWRNSVTHDIPHRAATQDWVLWGVDMVDLVVDHHAADSAHGHLSTHSSCVSSSSEDEHLDPGSGSATGMGMDMVVSRKPSHISKGGMEFFTKAKSVRLLGHHDKYLLADDDGESVCQDRCGSVRQAKWTVEVVEGAGVVRLKSCYGKYLTASNVPFLLGMTGKKVLQTLPTRRLDSSLEWEPLRDGVQVRLKTRYGNFLRANGGLPPWRNSITHDIPHRTSTQDWILWDVDVLEIREQPTTSLPEAKLDHDSKSLLPELDSPSSIELRSPKSSELECSDSFSGSAKAEGRMIYYKVADEDGNTEDENEELSFTFMGGRLEELVQKLEEETGHEDIMVCSQWNKKLYPLRLQLPPNNAAMHVVVVPSSSKAARDIEVPGSLSSR